MKTSVSSPARTHPLPCLGGRAPSPAGDPLVALPLPPDPQIVPAQTHSLPCLGGRATPWSPLRYFAVFFDCSVPAGLPILKSMLTAWFGKYWLIFRGGLFFPPDSATNS